MPTARRSAEDESTLKRRSLLAAVRRRARRDAAVREAAQPEPPVEHVQPPVPRGAQPDHALDQLAAEAQYHRDRFELYRARVISGSPVATSAVRLRELERTATAAAERLAHARRSGRGPRTP